MQSKEILGHPRGLFVLFFTEMWERFSFYGMRALLVLYMTQHLFQQIEQGHEVLGFSVLKSILEAMMGPLSHLALSSQIYGLYTGLVYFTPFFGGIIADKYFGYKKSIYIGGALMAIGHLLMAIESMFLPALFFLIIGNGFFKPNISSQVGHLYEAKDPRRDRAFTIFYMGINLGAFFSPLVCGTLGQKMGWHYGFGAAGIGMLIGLAVYHFGQKNLPVHESQRELKKSQPDISHEPLSKSDYQKIAALIFLCTVNILFWSVYEQQGNTLQIWADKNTNWNLWGFDIPSTWMQSFNPLFIFILAPVLDRFWNWQSRRKTEPSSVIKMSIACVFAALAYAAMIFILSMMVGAEKMSFIWLTVVIGLFTIGELYLSPIGLSLVTKLAPARMGAMLMGMWFFSSFFGNSLSGYIGGFNENLGDLAFFKLLVAISVAAAVIFLIGSKPVNKIIQENK